jgi:hypothetical protein
MWSDELVVVHISKGKTKEKEPWDQGGAVIAGMKTALQPYKHDVFDLEVCTAPQTHFLRSCPTCISLIVDSYTGCNLHSSCVAQPMVSDTWQGWLAGTSVPHVHTTYLHYAAA